MRPLAPLSRCRGLCCAARACMRLGHNQTSGRRCCAAPHTCMRPPRRMHRAHRHSTLRTAGPPRMAAPWRHRRRHMCRNRCRPHALPWQRARTRCLSRRLLERPLHARLPPAPLWLPGAAHSSRLAVHPQAACVHTSPGLEPVAHQDGQWTQWRQAALLTAAQPLTHRRPDRHTRRDHSSRRVRTALRPAPSGGETAAQSQAGGRGGCAVRRRPRGVGGACAGCRPARRHGCCRRR